MKFMKLLTAFAVVLLAVSCNDDDKDKKIEPINKNASVVGSYDNWAYIDLETGKITNATVEGPWEYYGKEGLVETKTPEIKGNVPAKWHIAFHNYDARTNGGEVIMTDKDNIKDVEILPTEGYQKDEKVEASSQKIIVDMKDMMKGKIGYAGGKINNELSKWVKKIPTGAMPPFKYEIPGKVFVIKFFDGSVAKVKFTDHLAGDGKKKAAEFEYEFIPAK